MSGAEWVSVHERMPQKGEWVLLAGGRVGNRHIDIIGLCILSRWGAWVALSGTPVPEAAVVEFWHPLPETGHLVPHEFRKSEGLDAKAAP